MQSDVFICHASEDKDSIARPLAEALAEQHLEVWYDEFSLRLGDSLRQSIDRGLAGSRFGVVILSPAFFLKHWSQWELDGLVARQLAHGEQVIVPIWHEVGRDQVLAFSPSLADKLAASTASGLTRVVQQILQVVRPSGSTLIVARDELLSIGLAPPVVTDDWWLDVAAEAESNEAEGSFQESMGWGRWGFPLPPFSRKPAERGHRMARAAAQMLWKEQAGSKPITQVTPPDQVHDFLLRTPGLLEAARNNINFVVAYAPQLVIRGHGGPLEDQIEEASQRLEFEKYRLTRGSILFALRDRSLFPAVDEAEVACAFVQGEGVVNGPPVRYYEVFDYLLWLLSSASAWLPAEAREILRTGMRTWGVWPWSTTSADEGLERGALSEFIHRQYPSDWYEQGYSISLSAQLDDASIKDLRRRARESKKLLRLPESGDVLAKRFLKHKYIDTLIGWKILGSQNFGIKYPEFSTKNDPTQGSYSKPGSSR